MYLAVRAERYTATAVDTPPDPIIVLMITVLMKIKSNRGEVANSQLKFGPGNAWMIARPIRKSLDVTHPLPRRILSAGGLRRVRRQR